MRILTDRIPSTGFYLDHQPSRSSETSRNLNNSSNWNRRVEF